MGMLGWVSMGRLCWGQNHSGARFQGRDLGPPFYAQSEGASAQGTGASFFPTEAPGSEPSPHCRLCSVHSPGAYGQFLWQQLYRPDSVGAWVMSHEPLLAWRGHRSRKQQPALAEQMCVLNKKRTIYNLWGVCVCVCVCVKS